MLETCKVLHASLVLTLRSTPGAGFSSVLFNYNKNITRSFKSSYRNGKNYKTPTLLSSRQCYTHSVVLPDICCTWKCMQHSTKYFPVRDFHSSVSCYSPHEKETVPLSNQVPVNNLKNYSKTAKALISEHSASFREGKTFSRCTIVEEEAAEKIVTSLLRDLKEEDTIGEINPGPGVVTRQLLSRTTNKLILFEPRHLFRAFLKEEFSSEIEEGRVVIAQNNFSSFYAYYVFQRKNNDDSDDKLDKFLSYFPTQKQWGRSNMKVVGVINDRRFYSRVALCTILEMCMFEKCYPTFYLYVTDKHFKMFYSSLPFVYTNNHFRYSVQNTFTYQTEKLDDCEANAIYPVLKPKHPGRHNIDYSRYHLMRIEPDWFFLNEFNKEEREFFMFFLVEISRSPSKNLVIDTLELYIPDFGVTLIDAGFRVYTFSQELSREEILFVYHLFRRHPGFELSDFLKRKTEWFNQVSYSDEKHKDDEETPFVMFSDVEDSRE